VTVSASPAASLEVPKAADLVAERIRRQIVRGELAQGEWLPRESELMAQWKVGRPALREALRVLESEGLIRVLRGNIGGAVVQAPSIAAAARSAAIVLQVERIPLRDIYDARLILETAAAHRAATVATEAGLADLEALLAAEIDCVDDATRWALAAVRFHEGVVQAAGVRTLALFSDMTSEIIDQHQVSVVSDSRSVSADDRRRASRAHAKLLQLLRAGDAKRVQAHWHAHISELNGRYFDEAGER
jgi:DNA-binding FadR family transcriptional regulator